MDNQELLKIIANLLEAMKSQQVLIETIHDMLMKIATFDKDYLEALKKALKNE